MRHEPEELGPEQDARDESYGRREFWVYVLTTEYGHYVGHTSNPTARMERHRWDEVESTAGGNAVLAWMTELPFDTWRGAVGYEAALKSWRDSESIEFTKHTGLVPVPWRGWSAWVEAGRVQSAWEKRVERTKRRKVRTEGSFIQWEDLGYLLLGCLIVLAVGIVVVAIVRWIFEGLLGGGG